MLGGDDVDVFTLVSPSHGMSVALPHGVRWQGSDNNKARGRVIDHCMLCSEAAYEGQESVHFFGLYVHVPCYRRETEFPDRATDHQSAA